MQIEIELTQKNNICSGAYAIYRKNDQLLELSGNSQIKQGEDTFRAQQITLDLNSQEITLDGRVKGSIIDEQKNAESENPENSEAENTAEETESGENSEENAGTGPDGKNSEINANPEEQTEENTEKSAEKTESQEKPE